MNNKKFVVIVGIMLLTVFLGVTYAYWNLTKVSTKKNVISSGCLKLSFKNEGSSITLNNVVPITDEEAENLTPYTFSIENTCSSEEYYQIALENIEGTTLDDKYVRVKFNDVLRNLNKFGMLEKTLDNAISARQLEVGTIAGNTTLDFSLKLYLSGETSVGEESMEKVFKSRITITAALNEYENTTIPDPVSFATDSWETISEAVKNGEYPYQVGNKKCVALTGYTTKNNNGCTDGKFALRIANTSQCVNGEESETACGFVLEFEDIITYRTIGTSSRNSGGYPSLNVRTYLNDDIYNALPTSLRESIIDTNVVSGHGYNSGERNFTTTDKIYLLSFSEIKGSNSYDTAIISSRQLDYYKKNNVSMSSFAAANKNYNGNSEQWWTRTPYYVVDTVYGTGSYLIIWNGGGWSSVSPNYARGISPAFRIG